MAIPKKLAVYYGWPSSVNATYTVPGAIAVFDDYDLVIFGSGLEDPTHGDHQNTKDIIDGSTADIFGYVDATLSESAIETKVDQWAVMGGSNKLIAGIFFDRFGFDFGLTRQKQNNIVDYVHGKGLPVFVNAWDPDDVFQGANTKLTTGDYYLAESHYIINGEWQNVNDWETKSDKMAFYKSQYGTSMACVTTTTTVIGFDQNKWDNAYCAHAVYDFDASGWGEPNFSASDAQLPFRARYPIEGTIFTGNLVKNGSTFERQTNVGIHIDTINKTVNNILG